MAHMHYKGTGKVHSFRGLLADGGQDKISIQGSVGAIAWRITKLNIMLNQYTGNDRIHGVSVWREEQTTIPTDYFAPDFNDAELLAASIIVWDTSQPNLTTENVIFDNALFSRNIWVSHTDESTTAPVNYYIELEEVKVNAAGMAQLAVAAARRLNV